MEEKIYDLIIIGGGPAGLTASIYASRYKLKHVLFSKEPGGQLNEVHKIENYPGFLTIPGFELGQKMVEQVKGLGGEIRTESVTELKKMGDNFELISSSGKYLAKNVILTVGTEYRKINIPGEKEFKGKGVSYCSTCDAAFFKDKAVAVVGGANSAAMAALLLTEYASKIYLVYRKGKLRCDPVYLEKITSDDKIKVIYDTNILEIKGESVVQKIVLDKEYEGSKELEVQGVFIEIGSEPGVELARSIGVELDEQNFIKVNSDQSTNIPGIWAAGDVTTGSSGMRQIITAASEGAVAAGSVYKKLQTG